MFHSKASYKLATHSKGLSRRLNPVKVHTLGISGLKQLTILSPLKTKKPAALLKLQVPLPLPLPIISTSGRLR